MSHIEAEGSEGGKDYEETDIEIYHMVLLLTRNDFYFINLSLFKVSINTILIPVAVETLFSSK
jgi:hypothetical protein